MMSSQTMQTFMNPVFRCKMPLFDGTIATTGLPKPKNMSDFLGKQTLQNNGAYFAYDPRGKDAARFTSPWSNSKTSLLDSRSPVSHLSGMDAKNHIIYRQDSSSPEEGHPHSSPLHHAPVKRGFTFYTKSPGISSPTAAASGAARKQNGRGDDSSPPSGNSVYLAIPQPVYGRNPCCDELGCVMGQRYSVEIGSPRIPNAVYEPDWMQTDAHYADRPPIQRKAPDALLQQRGLQFEPRAEPLKRIPVETYSPGRARTYPAVFEPNYGAYPCTLTRRRFGSLSEQSQQTSPRGYPGLYPSHHPTYENMTSEVYQEHSPMSKYGHLPQPPMFYYPQANVEVENRPQCKDVGSKQRDVPVILKHTITNPREHYIVPQQLHGEIPFPLAGTETLPNHSFMRGFDYPYYAVPRYNLNASPIRNPLKRQRASPGLHSNHVSVSSSGQCMDHHMASAHPHQDRPSIRVHTDQSHTSFPFLRVDQSSPTRRRSHPDDSASGIHFNRFFPPLGSLYIDRPVLAQTGLSRDRFVDYSPSEAQVGFSMQQQQSFPVSPAARLPHSPHHGSDRSNTDVRNHSDVRKIIYSPAVAPGSVSVLTSGSSVRKGHLKRSMSRTSSPIKIKEEERDLCEVEFVQKRQKVEMEKKGKGNESDSPPMPVIDTVFSLAPYQAYLQASGVTFLSRAPQGAVQSSEPRDVKPDIGARSRDGDALQPVVCLVSKDACADDPPEKPVVEHLVPKKIKMEIEDPTDTPEEFPVSQRDCSQVKKEPEETSSSDSGHMLVIKKCEPEELESKPSLAEETSNEPKPVEATAQMDSSPQADDQEVTLHPKSITPPKQPESPLDFTNIPTYCLKLSAYKVVRHDPKFLLPVPPSEKPPAQLTAECVPKLQLQIPVRKHFYELHHSLAKLVSTFVFASSDQELRTWLSQLELTEAASPSTKVQKVSSLLGVKAREVWLNEEIKLALHKLLERLREYAAQERCPFPHVMRTGAVFLPMLVLKELLFPMVQGSFIDQVLQEHRVALRPTTLSEEKILIQLHKRACSSRLRRLMSLKHLPDIYADVVNLLYYTSVCKQLGLDADDPAGAYVCEEAGATPVSCDITASPASPAESYPLRHPTDRETKSDLNRTKSRVKSSSRRTFLDDSLSDEEKEEEHGGMRMRFGRRSWSEGTENVGDKCLDADQDPNENSWTRPLNLDDLSSFPSDPETEEASGPPAKPLGKPKNSSGVILKLRRMFSKGLHRKKASYQAIPETPAACPLPHTDGGELEVSKTPKVTHRWQRTGSFSRTLRPLSSSSKRKRRSLLKIKYCPYLSACHSAEHRRRWVLRSAVQRAQRAMRFPYPDLVGKRIRHLYEEDDKSEVWYRGEVLRVHEVHDNPLKTIFEVRYDSEPEWKYYLELLVDYKKGWLKIDC